MQNVSSGSSGIASFAPAIGELSSDLQCNQNANGTQISVHRIGRDARPLTPNELLRFQHMFASNMPVNSTARSDVPQRRVGPELTVQNVVPSVNEARNVETSPISSANNLRNSGTQTNPASRTSQMRTLIQERLNNGYYATIRQAPVSISQNQYYSFLPTENRENVILNSTNNAVSNNSSLSDSSPSMPIRNANYIRVNSLNLFNPLSRPPRTLNSTITANNDVQNISRYDRQGNDNLSASARYETSSNARRVTFASDRTPMMRFLHEMDNLIGNNRFGNGNS